MALEMGSARNTPRTPSPSAGNSSVRGTTIITLRNSEKKMACFTRPRARNTVCPENWKAMKKKPKNYSFSAPVPASSMAASSVKMKSSRCGHCITTSHAAAVYRMPSHAVNRIPWHTLSYCFAP